MPSALAVTPAPIKFNPPKIAFPVTTLPSSLTVNPIVASAILPGTFATETNGPVKPSVSVITTKLAFCKILMPLIPLILTVATLPTLLAVTPLPIKLIVFALATTLVPSSCIAIPVMPLVTVDQLNIPFPLVDNT